MQQFSNSGSLRPLITSNKRIILSNVCPVIPYEIIEKELIKIRIKSTSQISFLRAGLSEPGFSHILSFRRQVFVKPEDVDKLPASLNIFHEDTNYWIYLSGDNISCYLCKKEAHLAKNCPDVTNKDNNTSGDTSEFSKLAQRTTEHSQATDIKTKGTTTYISQAVREQTFIEKIPQHTGFKRLLSVPSTLSTHKSVLEESRTHL